MMSSWMPRCRSTLLVCLQAGMFLERCDWLKISRPLFAPKVVHFPFLFWRRSGVPWYPGIQSGSLWNFGQDPAINPCHPFLPGPYSNMTFNITYTPWNGIRARGFLDIWNFPHGFPHRFPHKNDKGSDDLWFTQFGKTERSIPWAQVVPSRWTMSRTSWPYWATFGPCLRCAARRQKFVLSAGLHMFDGQKLDSILAQTSPRQCWFWGLTRIPRLTGPWSFSGSCH
jgi:hypothetical protein